MNGNGVSDVWEALYNTGAIDPAADANGDGTTNFAKSIAGVNPYAANTAVRPAVSLTNGNPSVTWPTVLGKQYQLQSAADLSGGWTSEGAPVVGTGASVSRTLSATGDVRFYQVVISDTDSNSDGLNDWEALLLGLSTTNAFSNGRLDAGGNPISDIAFVTGALSAANVVTVTATKAGATVPNVDPATDSGTVTVTRTGNFGAITVPLVISGVAQETKDYATLPRSVTLPFGVNSATLTVKPLAASTLLTGEDAVVTAGVGNGFTLGSQKSATVIVYPSPTPAGNGLTGKYFDSGATSYADPSNFNAANLKVTRVDPTVDFFWGKGTPSTKVNRDGFAASWDGDFKPTTDGDYIFALQADDGARLIIDGVTVIDAWAAGSSLATPKQSAKLPFLAGSTHPIRVEYREDTGAASIAFTYLLPGGSAFTNVGSTKVFRPGLTTTGWAANYYNNTDPTGAPVLTQFENTVANNWGAGSPDPSIALNTYSVRWTGQVQPQYSEPYTFVTRTDDGAKLWVNGQLITNNWKDQTVADVASATINLQAGVRYDIQLEYYQNNTSSEAHLSWYSPSQAQQIIPQSRLYPTSAAPTNVTTPTSAIALVGGPFSLAVSASNSPTKYIVTGLPPGLIFNSATGLITGTATQAGNYQILITASNGAGTGVSAVSLTVTDTGRSISREVWTGIGGTDIGSIPVDSPPDLTGTLTSLEDLNDYGADYGERIRGYLTAPVTGNYYFWVSGGDSAQLWVSNDGEPVNKVRRSLVTSGAGVHTWSTQAGQRSAWLSLVAGQRYYIEALHKVGPNAGGGISVGWLRPDQSGTAPSEVAPGYILSPFKAPVASAAGGTLYNGTLLPSSGSTAVGAASLRLSDDGTQAVLSFNYNGLSSPLTADHIDSDPYLSFPGQLLFDIAAARPQPDGTYLWKIKAVGTLSASDVVEIVREGKAYVAILTANFPAGELRGNLIPTEGAQTFDPPPTPPVANDDHDTDAGASRFLTQATFGPIPVSITDVRQRGYSGWITAQMSAGVGHHLPYTLAQAAAYQPGFVASSFMTNTWWKQSVTSADQLRQRVAFALSEITVLSNVGVLNSQSAALSTYYDVLLDNAFGNYRDLLKAVTLSPAMGNYLNMRANDKANLVTGLHPNENYGREIMQLFSIGLNRLWPDGTLVEDSSGNLVPTYDQNVVQGFATAFTGWNYYQAVGQGARLPTNFSPSTNYLLPMTLVPTHHDLGPKRLLDNVVLPPAVGAQADSSNVAFDSYCSQDLDAAIDNIFNNQNVGPFVCRQLIQRLVTSNPSRGYLYRVVQAFNDNGSGVRGDLGAVVRAILLDYEARSSDLATSFGKQREPLLRVTAPARYFASALSVNGDYSQTGTDVITFTSTTGPHRLTNGDVVTLSFTGGAKNPTDGAYTVSGITGTAPTTFTMKATGLLAGAYSQVGTAITATLTGHGLKAGNSVYLSFPTGGAKSDLYPIDSVATNTITVTSADSINRSGTCIISKFTANGFVVAAAGTPAVQSISVSAGSYHHLAVDNNVYLSFSAGTASGIYQVTAVADSQHFTVAAPNVTSAQAQGTLTFYPLVAPPLNRTGQCAMQTSTWNMSVTDANVTQTPLNSTTVFNFFSPDYRFPGALAAAGLTTPEFELTTDTNIMLLTNTLTAGILNSGNANGLTSFLSGGGAIVMDMGPYLASSSNAGIPGLVDLFNAQLMGGSLLTDTRTRIISYAQSLAYSAPPTSTQQRDRVRAIVQLIITSPEFAIQR